MTKYISYLNVFIGVIALVTNVGIITLYGLELYGAFALVLLCQSIGSVFFDLGYSNIIIQKRLLSAIELHKLELMANAAVIIIVISGLMLLSKTVTLLNPIIIIFWCVCSVRSSINVALLQREKEINKIIFGDGLQVIIFFILAGMGSLFAVAFDVQMLSYLLLSQLVAQAAKTIYTQLKIIKPDACVDSTIYEVKGLAISQVLDRSTRLIVSKGEQIIFTLLFTGAELGLFLFLSNVSVQFLSRLSSPQTRYLVALSKDSQITSLSRTVSHYYNRYLTTVCIFIIFSVILLIFGANFIAKIDQAYSILIVNYNIIILIAIISLLRIDMDFYIAWLICIRKYYLIPGINLAVGLLVLLQILVFTKVGLIFGMFFGIMISLAFGIFERYLCIEIRFWYKKTILVSLLTAISIFWL